MYPRLRSVQPNLIEHQGSPYVLLRDPLGLSESTLIIPQPLAPLLALCDGTRDTTGLQKAFELYTGIQLSHEQLTEIIDGFDQAMLLENENSANRMDKALDGFRSAPCRPPALSGGAYPPDPDDLKSMLEDFFSRVLPNETPQQIRGIVCPHIDYQRGGSVYASVWQKVTRAISEVEVAVIFGTNHLGGKNLFSLTCQQYATPFGTLPTSIDIVDRLAGAIGVEAAFEDELYHRNEHSIELALIWLHYLLGTNECEVVPILCGTFEQFINGNSAPVDNTQISALVECLQQVAGEKRMLVVAAADMAHMGPAFGDIYSITDCERQDIEKADKALIQAMRECEPDVFFNEIKKERDSRRICGLAPIYMMLKVLGQASGEECAYAQCPADELNGSLVSICGVILK